MNMNFERKLAIPMEVKEMYPLTGEMAKIVDTRAVELKNILSGKDDRIVLIIGPCSADNEDSVIDYISRLAKVQEKVKDQIFIIPRIYTNKPRTT
ncbi:MAG: 3-deoxy-7-phosphoheptulonate synthase, partial [Clostridia bacterium]|nr:3-deoxy-7-phosphoheptulonate synthase [Clostridia bacterium]